MTILNEDLVGRQGLGIEVRSTPDGGAESKWVTDPNDIAELNEMDANRDMDAAIDEFVRRQFGDHAL